MNKKITGLLLLLLPFSVLSEPQITCVPDSNSAFETYFFPAIGFVMLFGTFCIATSELFDINYKFRPSKGPWLLVVCVDAVVIGLGIMLASYTLNLVPDKKAVVNEAVMMSAPEVKKGLHYQKECILFSQNDTTVELRCRPDAVSETVPQIDYTRATEALKKAEAQYFELMVEVSRNKICRPESQSTFFDLFPDL
ncbi:hypothetical protein SAMN03159428_04895 [Kosakonia radicincitans]|uniref:Uncharacterized protein n=1 Tax=Kosakonia radicincitans TaxID=283686 RepID=A0AAX2EZ22_9ENTR|nr:hypothetical protein [Kosakonia radicincitans]SFF37691.1 hypothetical protein SAMN03159468_04922 [Kosakonia radicincitans]SFR26166.1 hypothetical protein SAMN03159514_04882 [Kosakonia radicincitans]SFU16639.1 hypothetical protein SAMN03159428_04895 [Kosakonia radicincitans]SFY31818.1 hypothetical protein SAMN03159436_04872 [Kosakonia radicincitans]